MQHSLHTNYQTSFRVEKQDDQTFYSVLQIIFDWLKTKEKETSLRKGWNEFIYRGEWKKCFKTDARINTNTCLEGENEKSWAVEYIHPDRELKRERYWHTHIGIRVLESELIVAVRIAYSWNQENLNITTDIPTPSVPYFVRRIVKEQNVFTGGKMLRVMDQPAYIRNINEAELLPKIIFSNERKYPLIIFNGSSEQHLREAKKFATQLTGKAQVLVIQSDFEIATALKECLPSDFHINYRKMRVFYPINLKRPNPQRHRYFNVESEQFAEQQEAIVHGLLCNHSLLEHKAIHDLSDIRRLIAKQSILKLRESKGATDESQVDELFKLLEETETEKEDAKTEAQTYASMVDELESEKAALEKEKSTLHWKMQAQQGVPATSTIDLKSEIFNLPDSLYSVVELASKLHSDTLVFAREAFESAKKNSQCELIADAWSMISHLSSTLYEMKFKTEGSVDFVKEFPNQTGYTYSKTEGPNTKSDARLSRLRKISHNNKDYEIWTHIGKGNDSSGKKCIRIHFDYDNEERKILIGFVGAHMDNAST